MTANEGLAACPSREAVASMILDPKHRTALDVADAILALITPALRDAEARGMNRAANICGSLAETTYDDADGFAAAIGCEYAICAAIRAAVAGDSDAPPAIG